MKKAMFVLGLTVALVLAFAAVAYADTVSGYLTPSGSPHGAYATNSEKCGVCHAVHKATAAGQILMRGTQADACTYCHITTATGLIRVYNATEANYNTTNKYAHNSSQGAACVTCHTPHGADALIIDHAYLEEKILKGSSVELAVNALDSSDLAVSKWCTNCHNASVSGTGNPYFETAYDTTASESSHVMIAASADYATSGAAGTVSGVVAYSDSDTCRSCHADGLTNQSDGTSKTVASSYPHYTTGMRFLTAATTDDNQASTSAADSEDDGVCIRCHVDYNGGTPIGIGITF